MKPKDDLSFDLVNSLFLFYETTGDLVWRHGVGKGRRGGKIAGTIRLGYKTVIVEGKQYQVHRLVFLLKNGRWPDGDIDHRKGDRDDNRDPEIREATRAQNIQNSKLSARNKTGFKGVVAHRKSFCAYCGIDGRTKYLGSFKTAEDAARAYDAEATKSFGAFARLNFPQTDGAMT